MHAVTTSVEAVPIGENLWTVKINNGTTGPITALTVDVYVVGEDGQRTADGCVPAKGRVSLADVMQELLGQGMQGALGAIASQAGTFQGMYGMPPGALASLQGYSDVIPQMFSPAMPELNSRVQAMLTASFPSVLPAGQPAVVMYVATGSGQLQADIRFADEEGNHWFRPFGQLPRPVE